MILDKLLKTRDQGLRTIVHPLYQLFPTRLELKYYDQIKVDNIEYDFKSKLKEDLELNGLLCPMILDQNNNLKKSANRFLIIKNFSDASLFYKTKNEKEIDFFEKLNLVVWKMHLDNKPPIDFQFLFNPPMQKYTDECIHLLQEGVKK
jgi:hypothetical protein